MKTVAIIAEYNPFHYGHLYQLDKIKEQIGSDCAIIAIMSGNFTQRGEIAVADKTIRARAATQAGVDLVLELPFPYSASSAEFFASAGTYIAHKIGIVDYLAFGSEFSNHNQLQSVAEVLFSDEYSRKLFELIESDEHESLGYPKLCELAYREISGDSSKEIFSPNNILAIEYIKALRTLNSNIVPISIHRVASDYNSDSIIEGHIQSASSIRRLINDGDITALDFIPEKAREVYSEAYDLGLFPARADIIDPALVLYFRLNSPEGAVSIHDAGGGLYNRLHDLSYEANTVNTLIRLAETKKYTRARLRRAVWYSYLGVTSSEIRTPPAYTQVLAMSSVGCRLLKEIKKISDFPVITKPSAYTDLGDTVVRQKELSNKADSVFALAHSTSVSGKSALTFTPFVKKGD